MALLDICNLNIEIQTSNGRIKIVDGVNLSLNEGEISGLVGESGSGKSLIAKVICNAIKEIGLLLPIAFVFTMSNYLNSVLINDVRLSAKKFQ